jgi:hypothetical protein
VASYHSALQKTLANMPPEVFAHLDAIIVILKNRLSKIRHRFSASQLAYLQALNP